MKALAGWSPLQKKAAAVAVVLVLALFPNLFSILLPLAAVLSWAAGKSLIVGIAIGGLLFAGRGKTPKPTVAPAKAPAGVTA